MHARHTHSIPTLLFEDFVMFLPRIIGSLSFATRSTRQTDVCPGNKSVHYKQMYLIKSTEKYIDDQYFESEVRIRRIRVDDGTWELQE